MSNYIDEKLYEMNIEQFNISLFEMIRRIEKGNIILKKELPISFQWKDENKTLLIESIVLNIPIAPIYLCETADFKYEVMDGYNRIKTIYQFINNEIPLINSQIFGTNIYFNQLESIVQRKIEDYLLTVYILRYTKNQDIKREFFKRINSQKEVVEDNNDR